MGERTYYSTTAARLGTIRMKVTKTEKVFKKPLIGAGRYVDVTTTSMENVEVPLLYYAEDGRYFELFTGQEMWLSGPSYSSNLGFTDNRIDKQEDYLRRFGFRITFASYPTAKKLNATQFADQAKAFLPYKDQVVALINKKHNDVVLAYLNAVAAERAKQNAAQIAEKNSEDFLDDLIGRNK